MRDLVCSSVTDSVGARRVCSAIAARRWISRRRVAARSAPPSGRAGGASRTTSSRSTRPSRLLDLFERLERIQALGSLLQLARGLRSAQHQDGEQRELRRARGRAPRRAGAGTSQRGSRRRSRGASSPSGEPLECRADRRLVVLDDRVTVRRLVAGEPERVQRQRVGVGSRSLLLDQAAEHPDLDGVRVHAWTVDATLASMAEKLELTDASGRNA